MPPGCAEPARPRACSTGFQSLMWAAVAAARKRSSGANMRRILPPQGTAQLVRQPLRLALVRDTDHQPRIHLPAGALHGPLVLARSVVVLGDEVGDVGRTHHLRTAKWREEAHAQLVAADAQQARSEKEAELDDQDEKKRAGGDGEVRAGPRIRVVEVLP